jgi:8-oxo-dGTP diphosphatase
MAKEPKSTVAAIISRDADGVTEVLLARRNHDPFRGRWCLPGGHVDDSERPIEAVIREVREETGLEYYARYFDSFVEDIPQYKQNAFVEVFDGYGTGELKPDPVEVSHLAWFTLDDARSMRLAFWHNDILDIYADANRRDKRRDELLAEYNSLRQEVLQRINARNQSLNLAITATGIFIAAVAGQFFPPVALLLYPLVAVWIAVSWTQHDIRVGQIGKRIRDGIEHQLGGVKWENWLSAQFARESRFIYRRSTELTAVGVLVGTQLLTVALAILFAFIDQYAKRQNDLGVSITVLYIVLIIIDAFALIATVWLVSLRRREFWKKDS